MLDHVIARASGRSYIDFMRQEVFVPREDATTNSFLFCAAMMTYAIDTPGAVEDTFMLPIRNSWTLADTGSHADATRC